MNLKIFKIIKFIKILNLEIKLKWHVCRKVLNYHNYKNYTLIKIKIMKFLRKINKFNNGKILN
jgi:hypothetical protein